MPGVVSINYQNSTFTATVAVIHVANGEITLSDHEPISFEGTFTFDTLSISSSEVTFYSNSADTAVNGTVSLLISSPGSDDPIISANNFTGSVELTWPTSNGRQYQQISSGDLVTLKDFRES